MITRALNTVVDALKHNPSCLAAILLSAFFAGLLFYGYQKDADRKAQTLNILLERCIVPHEDVKP